jgi:hypothetical protein
MCTWFNNVTRSPEFDLWPLGMRNSPASHFRAQRRSSARAVGEGSTFQPRLRCLRQSDGWRLVFMVVVWVVMACDLAGGYQNCGRTYCLHLQYVSPKRRCPCASPHVVATCKNAVDVFTAVRTSGINCRRLVCCWERISCVLRIPDRCLPANFVSLRTVPKGEIHRRTTF